ncbi:hypothetical protein GVO57_03525 [Sphingomonas changnyeongensis]|uniref:Uncharacterized protein n=1 Tax=Sphingomonas changnyeongensis TaxID=2698679 RepID=A0A7Z2NUQ2_9SPHN|nr:hypothetical protein [Sphingomonas changnyeongensis]QHL90067.1 hypothetical protein GVO57_03525 [Sphingomonas changnyeongensis]
MMSGVQIGAMLAVLAAAPTEAAGPGIYVAHQPEIAAQLDLGADGRFRFALSYGGLDEAARGRWAAADGGIVLTTEPAVRPPRFAVVSDLASTDGALHVSLSDPDLLQGAPLTLAVTYADAPRPVFVEAEEDGRVPLDPARRVVAIVPDLPVFPVPLAAHPLAGPARRIQFRFEPNDMGVADFRGERLAVEGGALVLTRHGRAIRLDREGR